MLNAVELTVESSLPYEVNAYLPEEIRGSDGTKILDKNIVNIKSNSSSVYKTFTDINTKVNLLDNQSYNNYGNIHGIDIMLDGTLTHETDVYKGTIKFEVIQK